MSSPATKPSFNLRLRNLRLIVFLILILTATSSSGIALGQQINGRVIVFPFTIQWNKQERVSKYRLQIAADEKFQDVFFDGPIAGNRYTVKNLAPGSYYWRVAPADPQLGTFSRPVSFFLSGGAVISVQLPKRAAGSR